MFLEIKDIHKSFGENENRVEVLKGIDINVNQGEFVVMLGPSGSGKSTLLNIIGGIEESDEGSISIEGNSMNMMNEKKLSLYRRNHLGYIFQQYNLIPNLTVRENIEVGAYLSKHPLEIDPLIENLGLKEFEDGIAKLNTEGLQKLYEKGGKEGSRLLDTIALLKKADASYQTFTSLLDQQEGSVSFMIGMGKISK